MKRFYLMLVTVLLMVLLLTAARPLQETPGEWLEALVAYFLTLAGFAAFITFVVNLLKFIKVIPDGAAAQVVKWLNLAGLVIVGVLQAFYPDAVPVVDRILGLLAELGGVLLPVLALILGWPIANFFSGKVHSNVRGFPVLGKSYSHK